MSDGSHLIQLALEREYKSRSSDLGPDEDISVEALLPGGERIMVTYFGYSTIEMLLLEGLMNGEDISALVHYSSVQVIFRKIKKEANAPKRKMGFAQRNDQDDQI